MRVRLPPPFGGGGFAKGEDGEGSDGSVAGVEKATATGIFLFLHTLSVTADAVPALPEGEPRGGRPMVASVYWEKPSIYWVDFWRKQLDSVSSKNNGKNMKKAKKILAKRAYFHYNNSARKFFRSITPHTRGPVAPVSVSQEGALCLRTGGKE